LRKIEPLKDMTALIGVGRFWTAKGNGAVANFNSDDQVLDSIENENATQIRENCKGIISWDKGATHTFTFPHQHF